MSRIVTIGDAFSQELCFTRSQIQQFAEASGDRDPLHRDASAARDHRFDDVLVPAGLLSARLLAALSSHFTAFARPLHQALHIEFQRPAQAGETLLMACRVSDAFWKDGLGGDLVTLTGTVHNARELQVAQASIHLLVMPKSGNISAAAGLP